MNKICAVIPAFNEESTLGELIRKIKQQNIDVITIDDGSTDNTAAVAKKEATFFIKRPFNGGKGTALKEGFGLALKEGYDEIITIDADAQHNPEEIHLFIEKLRNSGASIVIGNRLHFPKGMPPSRVFCNNVGTGMVSAVCRQHVADALNGYRIIKAGVIKAIELNSPGFEIDPEILIKASHAGFKIDSINIECIYGSETSRIKPIRDGYAFLKLVVKSL